MRMESIIAFVKNNKWQVIFGTVAFISAILMLIIGFFRTLLIISLTSLGIGGGYLVDRVGFKGAWVVIKRLFGRKA